MDNRKQEISNYISVEVTRQVKQMQNQMLNDLQRYIDMKIATAKPSNNSNMQIEQISNLTVSIQQNVMKGLAPKIKEINSRLEELETSGEDILTQYQTTFSSGKKRGDTYI